jgi:hypothetical protein
MLSAIPPAQHERKTGKNPAPQIENTRAPPKRNTGVLMPMAQPELRASSDVHYCTTTHVLPSWATVLAATVALMTADVAADRAAVKAGTVTVPL